ncbi:type II toxin-antitoxin system RelE family toxin [Desulfosediminicola flagellatus]|uniref:type II toxin-antitoxin system RelE family toxin n=1 Tax=Desulfosediminicola flagellatus TaxID=2569541 RepID=UPI0010ABA6B6|nr:toxin [Desulfosediminicola flagellatus]
MDIERFVYQPMPYFEKKLNSVERSDPSGFARIHKIIDRLLDDPSNADGKMNGLYNGRFKKYVGRKDYRLIYYWCRLCRKENKRLEDRCDGCDAIPDNSVIFFDLYHKKDKKKFKEME